MYRDGEASEAGLVGIPAAADRRGAGMECCRNICSGAVEQLKVLLPEVEVCVSSMGTVRSWCCCQNGRLSSDSMGEDFDDERLGLSWWTNHLRNAGGSVLEEKGSFAGRLGWKAADLKTSMSHDSNSGIFPRP